MTTVSLGGSVPASFGRFRNAIEVFDIQPGTRQLTIPNGWSRIRVAVEGAGGGTRVRRVSNGTHGDSGGSGGGGYAEIVIDVVPGQTFTYTVGQAGDINADGGTSSFGGLISATGGKTATDITDTVSQGGDGGMGIGGDINTAGGRGGNGFDASGGGAGGGGASGHRYGNGGNGGHGAASGVGGSGGGWGGSANGTTPGPSMNRALLFDDGFGLGITEFDPPITSQLNSDAAYGRVGEGGVGSTSRILPNLGAGAGASLQNGTSVGPRSAGLGGGAAGGPASVAGKGGVGAVIVEVLG